MTECEAQQISPHKPIIKLGKTDQIFFMVLKFNQKHTINWKSLIQKNKQTYWTLYKKSKSMAF